MKSTVSTFSVLSDGEREFGTRSVITQWWQNVGEENYFHQFSAINHSIMMCETIRHDRRTTRFRATFAQAVLCITVDHYQSMCMHVGY